MAFKVRAEVQIDDTMRKLRALKGSIQRKVCRKAASKGAQATVRHAKPLVPIRLTFQKEKVAGSRKKVKVHKERFKTAFTIGGVSGALTYDGGLLKKSLGQKVKTYAKSNTVVAIVGPRKGFRKRIGTITRGKNKGQPVYADPVKYAHLVELGTRHSSPKPFLRPASNVGARTMAAVMRSQTAIAIQEASRA